VSLAIAICDIEIHLANRILRQLTPDVIIQAVKVIGVPPRSRDGGKGDVQIRDR